MKLNANTVLTLDDTLFLVPYRKYHVARYHEWMQSSFLQEMTASEPLSLEEEYAMQQSWYADADKCTFIITHRDLVKTVPVADPYFGAMIGDVNLYLNDFYDKQNAEIEVMIAEECARGQGLAQRAVLMMMHYGYHQLKIRKFTAKISESNQPSLHLFQKKLHFKHVSRSAAFQEVTLELSVDAEEFQQLVLNQTASLQQRAYPDTI